MFDSQILFMNKVFNNYLLKNCQKHVSTKNYLLSGHIVNVIKNNQVVDIIKNSINKLKNNSGKRFPIFISSQFLRRNNARYHAYPE
jgi:hypothetical protein